MKRSYGIALVLVALLAAFSLLHFRLMSSQTAHNDRVAGFHPSDAGDAAALLPTTTTLHVDAGGRLSKPLEKALAGALQNQPVVGSLRLAGSDAGAPGPAVLSITVDEQDYFWSPLYARSELAVRVAYATNGDIAFSQEATPHFRSTSDSPAIQLLGDYALSDASWGLVSKPGYHDYLADQIANTIAASLQEQLKLPAS
jgi:hypothetical protein